MPWSRGAITFEAAQTHLRYVSSHVSEFTPSALKSIKDQPLSPFWVAVVAAFELGVVVSFEVAAVGTSAGVQPKSTSKLCGVE